VESLALLVTLIVVSVLLSGAVSALVAWRNPDRPWSRTLGVLVSLPSLVAGGWLASRDVGVGARVLGGLVLLAGVAAFIRSAKKG
jgi:hypothetical protein